MFIGVDPSINSTGVYVLVYKENNLIEEKSYIIKPTKLTKKEQLAEQANANTFEYIVYDKIIPSKEENNTLSEIAKTKNFIAICDIVKSIIIQYAKKYDSAIDIYGCQEGISYGSISKTKSIFDLAGLNFMLRTMFLSLNIGCQVKLTIGTPGEIKKFASGNGNCSKDIMIELFKASHQDLNLPKIDDISDAYWMAKFSKYIQDK